MPAAFVVFRVLVDKTAWREQEPQVKTHARGFVVGETVTEREEERSKSCVGPVGDPQHTLHRQCELF